MHAISQSNESCCGSHNITLQPQLSCTRLSREPKIAPELWAFFFFRFMWQEKGERSIGSKVTSGLSKLHAGEASEQDVFIGQYFSGSGCLQIEDRLNRYTPTHLLVEICTHISTYCNNAVMPARLCPARNVRTVSKLDTCNLLCGHTFAIFPLLYFLLITVSVFLLHLLRARHV